MKGAWLTVPGFCALAGAVAALGAGPPELPPLNARIVAFAREHVGKRVGDGICITLATEAIEQAGGRRVPLDDPTGDYAWGRRIEDFKDALPGDVLQFRNAEFKGKSWVTKRRWISWHSSYPHHTAIVANVKDGGKSVTVLHQNVGGSAGASDETDRKVVREDTLRVDSLQPGGWVRIYRPIEAAGDR